MTKQLRDEADAILEGGATSETWGAIIRLVDARSGEELEELVDHLEAELARWKVGRHDRWIVTDHDPIYAKSGVSSVFFSRLQRGSMRVAPPHWVKQATTEGSPRLRLVDAVSLGELKLNSTQALKLLGREELVNLRHLDLHDTKLTKTFWKKAPLLPALQRLESLRVSILHEDLAAAVEAAPSLPKLRRLAIGQSYSPKPQRIGALLGSDMVAGVEVVALETSNNGRALLDTLRASGLPELREIEIGSPDLFDSPLEPLLGYEELASRIETITILSVEHLTPIDFSALAALDFGGVGELDLSGVNAEHRLRGRAEHVEVNRAGALEHVPGSNLAETVKRLRLGDLWSPELAAALDGQVELVE